MIIDINQSTAEKKNEFEIIYDNELIYKAKTPFMRVTGVLGLEKLRELKVYDLEGNEVYKTKYDYIGNKIEEFIPLKYLVTNSQKFNQYIVTNEKDEEQFSIYFEIKALFEDLYIIKYKDKVIKCYSINDGYILHMPIYDGDKQIGELLKSQAIYGGKDEYRIYLFDEYKELADSLSMLVLYLDRIQFNSSYISNKGAEVKFTKTYSKANKYYDSNWVKNNFKADDYFENVERDVEKIKDMVKSQAKKTLSFILIGWLVVLLIVFIALILGFM